MTTPKPIDQLTPEELRVECAESRGWFIIRPFKYNGKRVLVGENEEISDDLKNFPDGHGNWLALAPDYTDANAALTLAHALEEWTLRTVSNASGCTAKLYRGSASHFGTATGPHAFALALCRAYLAVVRAGKEQQG